MPNDDTDGRLRDELHSYATRVRDTGRLPSAEAIRELAHRRRQRRTTAAVFGVVLVGTLGVGLAVDRSGPSTMPVPPAVVSPAPSVTGPQTPSTPPRPSTPTTPARNTVDSDVSELTDADGDLGIDFGTDVLIDVADDGLDRYLAVSTNGIVDFTGTTADDSTKMVLRPAKVVEDTEETKNQLIIQHAGSCVADTAPGALRISPCDPDAPDQTWQAYPAGDAGLFELHGVYTQLQVDNGAITSGSGFSGLQALPFE